ncbi:hypothetical protein BASA83_010650 [Batrachochytrium salamandrivorans]|nr:hypothetical protein BASA83_010650 [Batrachochytrium salamandrivorans]
MDYRGLNKQTIKDRNPIPLISEMLRTLSTGKIFTTLDLRGAYNLLRIKEGDEPKTAFITKYGQFEFLVMPFGLANAPAQFQRMMNSLFRHMIRYIISPNGTSMDPSKISAVQDWPAPKKVRELQVFLGFTNFYRALVSGYSDITCHLTKLLKKDVPFSWGPEQETSFRKLKDAFSRPGFLAHPNDEQPFILETDASDFAISGVLHQHDQSNTLRPVAFYSRQMNNAERNYDIYDKELLAVVESFKHWRHFLQGGLHPVTVLCDHKNLEYLYGDQSNFQRIIDPDNVLDLQVAMADLDLHVLVHSTVLDKSTATYMPSNDRVQVMKHYHESLAHLKYGSIIDLITRRFWWPDMKKDLKNYISRCPECQLNDLPLGLMPHCQLDLPPVALPFERWGIDFYGPMVETKSGNGMNISHKYFCYSDSDSRCYWIPHFTYYWNTPRLPNDETPPRSSLMPLDEIERMEENSEFIARNLEEVGQARSAANVRTKAQAEAMRKRNGFDENTPDYYFKVGDMVKMKHHDRQS